MPWNQTTSRITGFLVTAAVWNDEVVENFEFLEEVAYQEFVSPVSITGTSEGAATAVVSAGAVVFEAVPHIIEFYSPRISAPTSVGLFVVLYDGTTPLGELTFLDAASPATRRGGVFARRLTPTAASHTYNVKAWVGSSTGTVDGGAGGAGQRAPGFIRITRVPTS